LSTLDLSLGGRIAIITGAGSGLGAAFAEELAAHGAQIVPATGELTDSTRVDALVTHVVSELGRVDILISDDSVHGDPVAHFNLSHAVWPHMVNRGYGRIALTSGTDRLGAVHSLVRTLALAGRPHEIMVNAITVAQAHPSRVARVAVVLAHERCPATGGAYHVAPTRITRRFVGETTGVARAGMTPEDLLDGWPAVSALDHALLDAGSSAEAATRMYARVSELLESRP
jgi:hypothetical protein